MRKQYDEPIVLIEEFELNENIALAIYDGSAPDIGDSGVDGEDFGF